MPGALSLDVPPITTLRTWYLVTGSVMNAGPLDSLSHCRWHRKADDTDVQIHVATVGVGAAGLGQGQG